MCKSHGRLRPLVMRCDVMAGRAFMTRQSVPSPHADAAGAAVADQDRTDRHRRLFSCKLSRIPKFATVVVGGWPEEYFETVSVCRPVNDISTFHTQCLITLMAPNRVPMTEQPTDRHWAAI